MSAAVLQANATIRAETEVPGEHIPRYYQMNVAATVSYRIGAVVKYFCLCFTFLWVWVLGGYMWMALEFPYLGTELTFPKEWMFQQLNSVGWGEEWLTLLHLLC